MAPNQEEAAQDHGRSTKHLHVQVLSVVFADPRPGQRRSSQASNTCNGKRHANTCADLVKVRHDSADCHWEQVLDTTAEEAVEHRKRVQFRFAVHCAPKKHAKPRNEHDWSQDAQNAYAGIGDE